MSERAIYWFELTGELWMAPEDEGARRAMLKDHPDAIRMLSNASKFLPASTLKRLRDGHLVPVLRHVGD